MSSLDRRELRLIHHVSPVSLLKRSFLSNETKSYDGSSIHHIGPDSVLSSDVRMWFWYGRSWDGNAIRMGEESSTDQNPNGLCVDSELHEIYEKLHKRVQERINGGSEGSVASSETVLEIFGKSRLGILHHKISKGQSSSKQTRASLEKQLVASQAYIKELQSRMTVFEAYMRKEGNMSMTPSVSGSEDTLEDEEDV